jgi:hypothetical protein
MNFAEIANKKMEEIERAPNIPVGVYRFQNPKLPVLTDKPEWEILEFQLRIVEVVDADVTDYKGEVRGAVMRLAFIFDKNDEVKFQQTEFRLKTFLEKHLACADSGMSMKEAMNASVNAQCLGTVQWKADKNDAELFHANITSTAPLE